MSSPLEVGLIDSYAHRVAGGVRVVLHLPDATLPDGEVRLRFRSEGRRRVVPARVEAAAEGVVVESLEPRKLGPGAPWTIQLGAGEDWLPVGARVLAARRPQPVALLVGRPTRSTVLPAAR